MAQPHPLHYFPVMRSLILILALAVSSAVHAADFSGLEIFIPVVSRVPGVNDTRWRTDLVIANRSETQVTSVKVIYEPAGSAVPVQGSFAVPARGTITIPDVLAEVYGLHQSYGTMWLQSTNDNVKIVAHARIYNVGTAEGEFGQVVQGMPIDRLNRKVWLNGLIGIRGNRTNIGIGNPNNEIAQLTLNWYDKEGNVLGSSNHLTVQPWDVLLLNDIFTYLNIPVDEGLTIRVTSNIPIYAYASIVRNDTGDAYTIIGDGTE